ncbi:CYTH and CHAD domain-containing protein [Frankia sp. CNm7]|uniref:CYTH and CHAD domain-containing protein n=1 Tax=Frankia nepalensis TaxID=1836974 RepID=A0A937RNJ7_9ACTN|nr:CYTH and CHAD domain-containing protein [Frankia nepalensis]MBL7498408.1 CYTH and CHAD domain-containing protein [Frankia nepalensis]MBL7509978.1 CYTH and CHAD domain-containing protein [Frankia nepalensis]MBL7520196.1 CYTH and CHAD domain-containing protein [Frankia nepalensis]MBL7629738.1 CYTH and CHAD domain-containing protein [Frankia nepalensis]
MGGQLEIERKYAVEQGFSLPRLDEACRDSGVAATSEPATFTQEAVYYDSEDLRLARAKVTLRRRTGGTDDGWHLKLPALAGAREEIHRPLEAGEPDGRGVAHSAPPADLLDIVFLQLRGAEVGPVARLVTTRTATRLLDPAGAALAEVVDDEVHAQTLGERTVLTRWREIEVEILGHAASGGTAAAGNGSRAASADDLLDAVGTVLRRAGATDAPHGSKLAHVLSLAGTAPPEPSPAPKPRGRRKRRAAPLAGEVLRDYLVAQVEALRAADPRVRMDEPDAVHKMRVATRRMRSTLRTFAPLFPTDLVTHLDRELGDLAGALSGARDNEVQLEYFDGRLASLPPELVRGPVEESLAAHLRTGMEEGRTAALAALRDERYLVLLVDLEDLVQAPLTTRARREAATELPKLVRAADQRFARKVAKAAATPQGHDRDELLHSARKQAKRLRYAGEALTPVFGADAKTLAKISEEAQEFLGTHQDATVAAGLLRAWGIEAQESGEPTAFTYGLLLGLEELRARTAERDFFDAWPALSHPRHRRWLKA